MNNKTRYHEVHYAEDMTLRDHFAAKSLQAMISARDWFANAGNWENEEIMFSSYAQEAYKFADAMIKEKINES